MNNLLAKNLPPRQAQTLLLCAHGMSAKESANAMSCSVSTINSNKNTLFYKLHANSTAEMIMKAFTEKFLIECPSTERSLH